MLPMEYRKAKCGGMQFGSWNKRVGDFLNVDRFQKSGVQRDFRVLEQDSQKNNLQVELLVYFVRCRIQKQGCIKEALQGTGQTTFGVLCSFGPLIRRWMCWCWRGSRGGLRVRSQELLGQYLMSI